MCCGFINVETHFTHQGYVDGLYIHPDYQAKGLGERAYLVLEAWAKAQGYARLSVDASYLSKGLFTRMGFIQIQRSYQQKLGQVIPASMENMEYLTLTLGFQPKSDVRYSTVKH